MEILKVRKTSKCINCQEFIKGKYKVVERNRNFHLSCYFLLAKQRLEKWKKEVRELSKTKYKKQMIIENL